MYEDYSKEQLALWAARFYVARNLSTPLETLDRLADDEGRDIRYWVARNPNTPPETLSRLANDKDYYVRRAIARNPNTPQYIRQYIKIKKFLNYYE